MDAIIPTASIIDAVISKRFNRVPNLSGSFMYFEFNSRIIIDIHEHTIKAINEVINGKNNIFLDSILRLLEKPNIVNRSPIPPVDINR